MNYRVSVLLPEGDLRKREWSTLLYDAQDLQEASRRADNLIEAKYGRDQDFEEIKIERFQEPPP